MSENDNNSNDNKPNSLEKFSEDEQKEMIEKMKKLLASEDEENYMLYAAMAKQLL